jgi:cbb3-type cytochrome oxidase subunit 1
MTQKYNSTVKLFAMTGIAWAIAASVTGLLSLTQVVFQWPATDLMSGYGIMRPLYTNMLVFGAGLSFFYAISYFSIGDEAGVEGKLEWLTKAGWAFQQIALFLGISVLVSTGNTGREYGELNFISDKLIALSLLSFLIVSVYSLNKAHNAQRGSMFSVLAGTGALAVFCIGNIGQPYSLTGNVPFFLGVQDSALQEFYRAGILGFFILVPVFAALYTASQASVNKPVASSKLANYQGLAMMVLIPLAGSATLATAYAPAWSWAIGFAAGLALFAAILAGVMNIHLTLSSGNTTSGALYFKIGIWVLLAYGVLRALSGLPAYQGRYGYTFWDMADIALDMQTYATLIFTGAVLIALEKVSGKHVSPLMGSAVFFLLLAGTIAILIGTILGGVSEASALSKYAEPGKLAAVTWADVMASGKTMKMLAIGGYISTIAGLIVAGIQGFVLANASESEAGH